MLRKLRTPFVGLLSWMLLLGAGTGSCAAQSTVPAMEISRELQQLAAAAHTVFVGQIVAVRRIGGVVEVRFRVEQPVVGGAGTAFVLREWAGMWAPGAQRYRVGQRVLAFVHGVSAAGFSSPVHGAEGLVPVIVQGARTPRMLDIRRVAASVVRAPGTRLPDETDGAVSLDQVLASFGPERQGIMAQPVRLPIPVRGRPPMEFSEASRATRLGSAGDREVSTGGGAFARPGVRR